MPRKCNRCGNSAYREKSGNDGDMITTCMICGRPKGYTEPVLMPDTANLSTTDQGDRLKPGVNKYVKYMR